MRKANRLSVSKREKPDPKSSGRRKTYFCGNTAKGWLQQLWHSRRNPVRNWGHMHRQWLNTMPKGATMESSKGHEFCGRILDEAESLTIHMPTLLPNGRNRSGQSLTTIDNHSARIETRPSGKLEEAVTCAVNQKAFLRTFLCHGEVEAGNSPVESAQRGMVVGR